MLKVMYVKVENNIKWNRNILKLRILFLRGEESNLAKVFFAHVRKW